MGKRIAVVGTGAVGGYTGAHMVRAGEDVTFIDFWPAHVDEMKRNGLRITHHEGEEPFSVKVRALHLTEAQHLSQGGADRHRLCLHQILRHPLGGVADPAISGARRLCRLVAELHERGDDRGCGRLGQDDGLHRQQHQRRPRRAGSCPSRRGQGRRRAHGLPHRRSPRHDHRPRARNLPARLPRRQRQGHRQSVGRALVKAGRQHDGERGLGLHRAPRLADRAKRDDPPFPGAARQRGDPHRPGARLQARRDRPSAARDDRPRRRGRCSRR